MEKINKEELMKKLNLTEEEMEKVVGGELWKDLGECLANCRTVHDHYEQTCMHYEIDNYDNCVKEIREAFDHCERVCHDCYKA